MSAAPYRTPARERSLSVWGLLERCIGLLVWRRADPRSLPARPESATAAGAAAAPGRAWAKACGLSCTAAAVIISGIAGAAHHEQRSIANRFATNPPGVSLVGTARALETAATGTWWSHLYPSIPTRLSRIAEAILAGRAPLLEASRAYERARTDLARLTLPERLLEGPEVTEPVIAALAGISTAWHRSTVVYAQIERALQPYRELAQRPPQRLDFTIVQGTPGHYLLFELRDAAGETRARTAPSAVGAGVSLPLVPGGVLKVIELRPSAPGQPLQVVETIEFALEALSQEIVFPAGDSAYHIAFDHALAALAPRWDPLSPAARVELGDS